MDTEAFFPEKRAISNGFSVRQRTALALEAGQIDTVLGGLAARAWASISGRRVARKIALPRGLRTLGVGGATLGGAGKTPIAIAIARALAERGEDVALVAHGYRARPGVARIVSADDDMREVGDDALFAARSLVGTRARVVVAPRRAAALALAARHASTAVVDGLLQAAPTRLDLSILVLDALAPWGAGACPPRGDLRAPPLALLAATDHVAILAPPGPEPAPEPEPAPAPEPPRTLLHASLAVADSPILGEVPLASLASLEIGLVLAVAHPERVARSVAALGLRPRVALRFADHAPFDRLALEALSRHRVDAWLTTARCATKLPGVVGGAPVLALRHAVDVAPLLERLALRL